MKPIFQTVHGAEGNCFQSALASLLECPLDEIPDLAPKSSNPDDWNQNTILQEFLERHNLYYLEISLRPESLVQFSSDCFGFGECILTVETSDPEVKQLGGTHAVVGRLKQKDGGMFAEVIHDPKGPLKPTYTILDAGWLVSLRPRLTESRRS